MSVVFDEVTADVQGPPVQKEGEESGSAPEPGGCECDADDIVSCRLERKERRRSRISAH